MKRVLSPHVKIYKFPPTAITSILTRITGIGLSGAYVAFGYCNLLNINLYKQYVSLDNNSKQLIKYVGIYTPLYHTLGGIRHFIWDINPSLLTKPKVNATSYILLGSSFIGTIILDKLI